MLGRVPHWENCTGQFRCSCAVIPKEWDVPHFNNALTHCQIVVYNIRVSHHNSPTGLSNYEDHKAGNDLVFWYTKG